MIRRAKKSDLDKIVEVHIEAFPNFFLTALGRRFLKLYYSIYIEFKHRAFVCVQDNGVIGFAVGTDDTVRFYRDLKKNKFPMAISLLASLVNVKVLKKIFVRAASILFNEKVNSISNKPVDFCELTSIGVSQSKACRGVGSKLLKAYEDSCVEDCVAGICLTTDKIGNDSVLKFYQKFGYTVIDEFDQGEGREMLLMSKVLGKNKND